MLFEKKGYLLLFFILLATALRLHSFPATNINHDESTYLIIGRDLVEGKSLYVDVTDTKPVGIFIIYAFFYSVFGNVLFLSRLFVAILVGISSYLIYLSANELFKHKKPAIAAGIIYILYTSTWSRWGVTPNTEIFFNLTTILGFWLLLKKSNLRYFLAGSIFGIGFMIKYLVLFDFTFLILFLFIYDLRIDKGKKCQLVFYRNVIAAIGFVLPFLVTNLYFYLNGNFEAFKFITYELPFRYCESKDLLRYFETLLDFLLRFAPITVLFFFSFLSKKTVLKGWHLNMFFCWIIGVLIAMYLPGKGFSHYAIQLMVPFSFVAGMFFHPDFDFNFKSVFIKNKKVSYGLIISLLLIIQISTIVGKYNKENIPVDVINYMKANMDEDDQIYVHNYKHILYFLLDKECPTKYVHPTLLTKAQHQKAFNIDCKKELGQILSTKPDFIVSSKDQTMESLIKNEYILIKTFPKEVKIFQRNSLLVAKE